MLFKLVFISLKNLHNGSSGTTNTCSDWVWKLSIMFTVSGCLQTVRPMFKNSFANHLYLFPYQYCIKIALLDSWLPFLSLSWSIAFLICSIFCLLYQLLLDILTICRFNFTIKSLPRECQMSGSNFWTLTLTPLWFLPS